MESSGLIKDLADSNSDVIRVHTDLGSRGAPASVPTEVSCNAENGVIRSWLHETRLASRRTRALSGHLQFLSGSLDRRDHVYRLIAYYFTDGRLYACRYIIRCNSIANTLSSV
ncbi:unnamed protein product [Trichogramma brassicae]|uniref:Uncharacterized protein n=1 Tax=Trichogramma brassicae TaxID=86971 RepID=A0A6H5I3Z7_9HYME|nr:unnamed protein product [Trichogramma brassicae]